LAAGSPGIRMRSACSAHEAQAYGRRFRRRDSVWTAAICRRFFPRAQAKPPLLRPCREQKRQQAGAVQTLARDTGRVQSLAFGDNSTLNSYKPARPRRDKTSSTFLPHLLVPLFHRGFARQFHATLVIDADTLDPDFISNLNDVLGLFDAE